jgi:FMN-dependent NADH-azoreductase
MTRILRLNAGANHADSVSRPLATALIDGLAAKGPVEVTTVELSEGMPLVDAAWIAGAPEAAAATEAFISQLEEADVLVISAPIYNFSVPAALKAWIDQIAKAGRTFAYTAPGQVEGLLKNKKAYVIITAGGVQMGSAWDYASPYLRHVLGFIGITNVEFIDASALATDAELSVSNAHAQISQLLAA